MSNDFSLRRGGAHLGCSSEEIPVSGVLIIKFNEENKYKVISTQSTPNRDQESDRDVYIGAAPACVFVSAREELRTACTSHYTVSRCTVQPGALLIKASLSRVSGSFSPSADFASAVSGFLRLEHFVESCEVHRKSDVDGLDCVYLH